MNTAKVFPELLVLFSGFTALTVRPTEAVEVDQACRGYDSALQCSQHELQCQQGTIFILQAARGFKLRKEKCPSKIKSCNEKNACCEPNTRDCLEDYTLEALSDLATECSNKTKCTYRITLAKIAKCNSDYETKSGYSVVHYVCLQDWAIQDFSDSRTMTGTCMVLRYNSSADSGNYSCLVEAEDSKAQTVDVTLVKAPNVHTSINCTTLLVKNESWPLCFLSQTSSAAYSVSTPATVNLSVVKENDIQQAWAVINSRNSSVLQITCKPWGPSFPRCSSPTMPSPAQEAIFSPSLSSAATSGTTSAVMVDDRQQPPDGSSNTARIVGVAAMVAVAVPVVVALIVVFIIVRCRHCQGKDSFKIVAWFEGGNSSSPRPRQSPAAMTPPSGRAESNITPGEPSSLPTYLDITTATTTGGAVGYEDQGSPYDHLRYKHMSPAPRDVIYSHLAGGKYINENDYDHLEVGKKTGRFGDVINNVYETVGPPDTGSSDRDPCNVTGGAQRGWQDINNVDDMAQPITAQFTEEDMDYKVSGEVIFESCDIKDSPYGLVKAVN